MTPTSNHSQTELISLPGSYEDRYNEAYHLFRRGDHEQAAAICIRLIDRISRLPQRRRPPDSPLSEVLMLAASLLADIRASQGDWHTVDELCQRMQAMYPAYGDQWQVEPFDLRIKHGQPENGLAGLHELAQSEPNSFTLWMTLADSALRLDVLDLAQIALERSAPLAALSDDPDDQVTLDFTRFQVFERRGEWYEAARAWNSARQLDPEVETMREALVRMYLEAGLLDDALRTIDEGALSPKTADYYRAWIANQRGDQVRARHLWRTVVETDSAEDEMELVVLHALSRCWLGQPDAALGLLLQRISVGGALNLVEALALALAWAMHGDVKAAHANLKLAHQRQTQPAQARRLLPGLDWIDFEQLVKDEAVKAELRPYFATLRRAIP
jgi:predicted Zn-dependent protease